MARLLSRAAQTIQKAVSPKPAKVGKQPGRAVAPKSAPKTKKVAKVPTNYKGKKIVGVRRKAVIKGKPISKKMTVKRVSAR